MGKESKTFSMVPIKRTDVFQTIIERISDLIANHLRPGDRLPSERELAESLGVSRTSVRQALKVLEAMGKVETKMGSGTYVTNNGVSRKDGILLEGEITKDYMRKLIVARAGIERIVFEECVNYINAQHINKLRDLLQERERELEFEGDSEDGGLDLTFEATVAEITENEILIKLQQQVHQLWIQAWRKYGYVPEDKRLLHQEHLDIIEAMERGDKQRVIDLIVQHVKKEIDS